MADKVYKKIEVTGCSTVSIEKAIEGALAKAGDSVRGISWFEVKELRGAPVGDGLEWQATILVAFKLD